MGLFIRQEDNRSELQERLAAELRERAMRQSSGSEPMDQTKDSRYVQDTEQTSKVTIIVLIAVVVVIVSAVVFFATR